LKALAHPANTALCFRPNDANEEIDLFYSLSNLRKTHLQAPGKLLFSGK